MRDCSVVVATYTLGGEVIGAIGVLGPTRMEYSKAVGMVEYVADHLSDTLLGAGARRLTRRQTELQRSDRGRRGRRQTPPL